MRFSRQEYWSGCHFLLQGIFPTWDGTLALLRLQADSLLLGPFTTWEAPPLHNGSLNTEDNMHASPHVFCSAGLYLSLAS